MRQQPAPDHFQNCYYNVTYFKTKYIVYTTCTCNTRTITNNDDNTAQIILPVDGTRGVVMESSDSIDPPLSQPEVSSGQSRNGWVLARHFDF